MKGNKKKSKDEVFIIEDLVRSRRMMFYIVVISLIICLLNLFVSFYFLFLKKDRVVLLDVSGNPQLSLTVPDKPFIHEMRNFVSTVVTAVYERSYIDFVDQGEVQKVVSNLRKYFREAEDLRRFWEAYVRSPYVKGVVDQRQIIKVAEILPFEFSQTKEGLIRGVGKIKVGVYQIQKGYEGRGEQEVLVRTGVIEKRVVIEFVKGVRSIDNPYGLYVVSMYET